MKKKNTTKLECVAGGYQSVRLRWLRLYMNSTGASVPDIAEIVGISRQSLWHLMVIDDCKLSRAEDIMDKLGYRMSVRLEKTNSQHIDDIQYLDDDQELKSDRRLAFIKDAMQEYRYTMDKLKAAMDAAGHPVSKSTLSNYSGFVDDIYLSRIYELADAMGLAVKFTIKKKKEE